MRRFFFTMLFIAGISPAVATAQQAPVKQDQAAAINSAMNPDKLTIRECLGILAGLNALDGRRVVIAAGKPTESVELQAYKLGTNADRAGKVRDAISHNIFMLGPMQQEAQVANRRAQVEIGKGAEIKTGTKEGLEFDARMADYSDRPCNVALDHIPLADLRVGENDLAGTIQGLLWKIIDR